MVSSPRSLVEPVDDRVVHLAALVRVPPARAFAYFTTPDLLTTWLTTAAEVEAVVGGRYELFWNPNDREVDSTIGCRITALVADELVAFQWRGPRAFRELANGADPLTCQWPLGSPHLRPLIVPAGGRGFSPPVASGSPRGWPPGLPTGGHGFSPG